MAQAEKVKEYQNNQIPVEGNASSNEAWALIEVSRRMAAVIEFGDLSKKKDKEKLRDAMRLNLRIWTVIQGEQSFGENLLPDPIRKNILNLCRFIDKHTIASIPEPTPEKIISLIDINRNIASGLLGMPEEKEESKKVDDKVKKRSGQDGEAVQVVV